MTTTIETRTDEIRGTTYHCSECGRWEKESKGGVIRHANRCESQAQFVPAPIVQPANELSEFAADVRRTATAKDRTDDLVRAVRTKRLSLNDAMNTDD